MTQKNSKRIKEVKYETEEQTEIKRFLTILIVLIILVLIVYFATRIFVTKDLLNKKEEETQITEGQIDYSVTLIGNMLNKTEQEYYVIMYDKEALDAGYYGNIATRYKQNTNPLPIYTADLQNEMNKKYVTESTSNLNPEKLSDFRVKNAALIKVKNGKIIATFETENAIEEELKVIKDTTN